jgi:hypothetical protein
MHALRLRAARCRGYIAAVAALGLAPAAYGQQVLLTEPFDSDDGRWTGMGGGKVTIVKDAAQAKVGSGVLRYDYEIKKGAPSFLLHPTGTPPPDVVKGLRFWVKTDAPTWLALILQERGGARYSAAFHSPGGAWQQVELGLADFGPGLDKNDPKDANNKLDITEVEGLGFVDIAMMFAEDGSGQLLKMLGLKAGARTLWLDEIEVLASLTPETEKPAEGEVLIDSLAKPHLPWLVTGWAKPALVNGAPLGGRAIKLEYKRTTGEIAGVVRFLPTGKLTGTTGLRLKAASTQSTSLLLQVEETGGGKYNALIEVPGGSQPKEAAPLWSEFNPDGESKDDNGKLDPGQIKQILIIDLAGMSGDGTANSLWLGTVRAVKAK